EARWLIERHLEQLERGTAGRDEQRTVMRLAREGDTIAGLQALAAALEATASTRASEPPELEPAPPVAAVLEPLPERPEPTVRRAPVITVIRGAIAMIVVAVAVALTVVAQLR